jgi:peptidoglycan LD-endopeptidase LytH
MKLLSTIAVTVSLLLGAVPPAGAQQGLDSARREANRAAAEFASAQTRLAQLEGEIAELERRAATNNERLGVLQQAVQDEAVRRYMESGSLGAPALLETDINVQVRADALARFATGNARSALDEYRAVRHDVDADAEALASRRESAAEAVATMRARRQAAFDELARVEELERQRRAREEAERRAREEAARKARQEAERTAQQEAAARQAAASPAGRVQAAAQPAPAPSRSAPSRPAPSRPEPAPSSSGGWVCPVQGPRSFSNDWGQPRSGGRRHQGTDILSPRGTPVVASVSGTVTHRTVSLGGLSYYLRGDDGNTYFGTHMSAYGASGRVSAGTVIGYVGDTGNARGTPHLHFEIHPGGGAPVNPYPTLSQHC